MNTIADVRAGEPLNPTKYGIRAYGVAPSPNGDLLYVEDVLRAIENMLDDDRETVTRLLEFREHLRTKVSV